MDPQGPHPEKGSGPEQGHRFGSVEQGAERLWRPAAPKTMPAPETRGPWMPEWNGCFAEEDFMGNAPFVNSAPATRRR